MLFDEWARICDGPGSNDKAYAIYLSQLQHLGMLKGDDFSDRFFRILIVCDIVDALYKFLSSSHHLTDIVSPFSMDNLLGLTIFTAWWSSFHAKSTFVAGTCSDPLSQHRDAISKLRAWWPTAAGIEPFVCSHWYVCKACAFACESKWHLPGSYVLVFLHGNLGFKLNCSCLTTL